MDFNSVFVIVDLYINSDIIDKLYDNEEEAVNVAHKMNNDWKAKHRNGENNQVIDSLTLYQTMSLNDALRWVRADEGSKFTSEE